MDINADMGEGFGAYRLTDDEALLHVVTSANVACGFHAGDPLVMRATCEEAIAAGVGIGAHPSFHDLAGFGRRFIDCSPDEIAMDVVYQISALGGIARSAGGSLSHIKLHGELYNLTVRDVASAKAVAGAVARVAPYLPILTLPGSVMAQEAEAVGLRVVAESFADRGYSPDGTLVPRRLPGAVITDVEAICERMARLATTGEIEAVDGTVIHLEVDSICVHGDTPGAMSIACALRFALEGAGVPVARF
jgi:UPF0271 protein